MTQTRRLPIPNDPVLQAEAARTPNGWVYDIDWTYRPEARVPPEAIRGSWRVDESGHLTGEFASNPNYRPVLRPNRKPAPYVVAGARHLRDEWVVEIDPQAEQLFPEIPEDMKVGFWYVDSAGNLTGQFRKNAQYMGHHGA